MVENDDFTDFVRLAEPRLRLALASAYEPQYAQE